MNESHCIIVIGVPVIYRKYDLAFGRIRLKKSSKGRNIKVKHGFPTRVRTNKIALHVTNANEAKVFDRLSAGLNPHKEGGPKEDRNPRRGNSRPARTD